jgi:RimJ/RimL family protein N-acetyltransferase
MPGKSHAGSGSAGGATEGCIGAADGMIDSSTIETERLRLVPLTATDAEPLCRLTDDPAIVAAISFLRAPFTLADAAALIARNGNGRDLFRGIRRRDGDVLVGIIGAHRQGTGVVEVGYWIGTAFQRRGHAFEAAEALLRQLRSATPPPRIVAECHPDNRASWGLLVRLGFRHGGAAGDRPGRLLLELPP